MLYPKGELFEEWKCYLGAESENLLQELLVEILSYEVSQQILGSADAKQLKLQDQWH